MAFSIPGSTPAGLGVANISFNANLSKESVPQLEAQMQDPSTPLDQKMAIAKELLSRPPDTSGSGGANGSGGAGGGGDSSEISKLLDELKKGTISKNDMQKLEGLTGMSANQLQSAASSSGGGGGGAPDPSGEIAGG